MPYYSDDEDIDVRIHRGRTSPFEYAPRPPIYQSRSGQLLEIASQRRGHSRSRSHDRRSPSPAPVIINNRIYNDHEDDYYEEEPRYLPVAIPQRHRSHSRPLPQSPPQGYMTREDYELERTRKELEKLKMEAQREEDEKRLKKELELRKLKEEKRVEEEKERAKLEAERAVKEWKAKEAEKERKAEEEKKRAKIEAELAIKEWKAKELEKKEKERKEKEEREKEYQHRLTDDLRRNGMDDRQIAIILKKDRDGAKDATRPTYTRLARRYLSLETLNVNRIDYTIDTDPEYVLIKRWVPEYEQDFLWNHTKELRERRYRFEHRRSREVLVIEDKKEKKHHHHLGSGEYEYEVVRKEKKRSKSPAPMLTFFAGAKKG